MNIDKPILVGRFWHMPDGSVVPNIAGGSSGGEGDGEGDKGGDGDKGGSDEVTRLKDELKSARSDAASNRVALRELKDTIGDLDADAIKGLISDADKRKQDDLTSKGKFDEAKVEIERRHSTQVESLAGKIKGLESRLSEVLIDNEIVTAASNNNAIKPAQITSLLKPKMRLNDAGSVEVLGADGKVALDESGKPMAVASYVKSFLDENLHFVKASGGGAGSTGATGGKAPGGNVSGESRIAKGLKARQTA